MVKQRTMDTWHKTVTAIVLKTLRATKPPKYAQLSPLIPFPRMTQRHESHAGKERYYGIEYQKTFVCLFCNLHFDKAGQKKIVIEVQKFVGADLRRVAGAIVGH